MGAQVLLFDRDSPAGQGSGCFIGMDEAGYGPNLGPLLLGVTKWQTPGHPAECDLYGMLAPVVSSQSHKSGTCLHLADSKQVFVGRDGFASLERSALALLSLCNAEIRSFHGLWNWLVGCDVLPSNQFASWYHDDILLPVVASQEQICHLSGQLQDRLDQVGLKLLDVRGDVVTEERFNLLSLTPGSNKALALSRLAFGLLKRTWDSGDACPTLFVGDKHGGRNRYDELLAEVLDGQFITRLEESLSISRYRVRQTELRFQMRGEEHLPVACASIIAKYVRELAMDQFNAYWGKLCPGVKPTRGYPLDAKRFRQAIDEKVQQLGLSESVLWRVR